MNKICQVCFLERIILVEIIQHLYSALEFKKHCFKLLLSSTGKWSMVRLPSRPSDYSFFWAFTQTQNWFVQAKVFPRRNLLLELAVLVLQKICRGRHRLQLQWPHLPMPASLSSSLSPDVFFLHSGGEQGWGWESRKHVGIGEGGERLGFSSQLCHFCSQTSFQVIILFAFKIAFNVYLVFYDMPKFVFTGLPPWKNM